MLGHSVFYHMGQDQITRSTTVAWWQQTALQSRSHIWMFRMAVIHSGRGEQKAWSEFLSRLGRLQSYFQPFKCCQQIVSRVMSKFHAPTRHDLLVFLKKSKGCWHRSFRNLCTRCRRMTSLMAADKLCLCTLIPCYTQGKSWAPCIYKQIFLNLI